MEVVQRQSDLESQNIPVRPYYKQSGMVSPQYDLANVDNHESFLQAIRNNDLIAIDYFLHPENTFRGKKTLGRKALYEATLQGNSDLVEQILSRRVRYSALSFEGLPRYIKESIAHARAYKTDPDYARIERLLLRHTRWIGRNTAA